MNKDFWNGKKVFLTGHTGFKGAWLCVILKHLGAEVTGYSLPAPTEPSLFKLLNIKDDITHIEANICDRPKLNDAIKNAEPDILIHMAAQSLVRESYKDPIETMDTNVTGTLNVLEACRGLDNLKSLLVITTDKCYRNDETGEFFREGDPLGGKDPYSASKACAEIVTNSYIDSFFQEGSTTVSTARAGNVIGGGDWAADRLIPDVIRAIENSQSVLIRNPLSTRPWQHVLEPLFGYMLLVEKMYTDGKSYSGNWNFGPEPTGITSVGEVLLILSKSLSFKIEQDEGTHPYESKTLGLNIDKAREKLGWRPSLTVEKAINWTGEWYQAYLDKQDLEAITVQQITAYMDQL